MAKTRLQWFGDEVLRKVQGTSERGMYAAAEEVLAAATAKAPKDTGRLRDSGYIATTKRSTYRKKKWHTKQAPVIERAALVAFAAFYAHMVEGGTSKMAAKPFLRPALDQTKRRAGMRAAVVMKREIGE